MEPEYWKDRWGRGDTGWNQEQPTPLMLKHWPALGLPPGSRVFVPLAGKSRDMAWLAAQGHRVLGVELSELAIEQFFVESGLEPRVESSRYGRHYSAGGIELIHGDAFGLDGDVLRDCAAVFDRAALIALPPPLRRRYANGLYRSLPAGSRGLLLTIEYPQDQKEGPPFSVQEEEVRALLSSDWAVDLLERRDVPASAPEAGDGLQMQTVAYRLQRR